MTRFIVLSLLSILLGGCVVVPAASVSYSDGYYRHGYYRDYGYNSYGYGYRYRGYYGDHGQ